MGVREVTKYIIEYDEVNNTLLDKGGLVMFSWLNASDFLDRYTEGNTADKSEVTMSLVDKGVDVSDIIKLQREGLI